MTKFWKIQKKLFVKKLNWNFSRKLKSKVVDYYRSEIQFKNKNIQVHESRAEEFQSNWIRQGP